MITIYIKRMCQAFCHISVEPRPPIIEGPFMLKAPGHLAEIARVVDPAVPRSAGGRCLKNGRVNYDSQSNASWLSW